MKRKKVSHHHSSNEAKTGVKKPLQPPAVETKRIDSQNMTIEPVRYATPILKTTSYESMMAHISQNQSDQTVDMKWSEQGLFLSEPTFEVGDQSLGVVEDEGVTIEGSLAAKSSDTSMGASGEQQTIDNRSEDDLSVDGVALENQIGDEHHIQDVINQSKVVRDFEGDRLCDRQSTEDGLPIPNGAKPAVELSEDQAHDRLVSKDLVHDHLVNDNQENDHLASVDPVSEQGLASESVIEEPKSESQAQAKHVATATEVIQLEQGSSDGVGLTTAQVQARIEQGLINEQLESGTRTVKQIIRENVITAFNILNLVLGGLVVIAGFQNPKYFINLTFLGVAICNTIVGIIQEIRAKKTIDRLAILTEPHVDVYRDGDLQTISVHEIVTDDVMKLVTGNQIAVDGYLIKGEGFEIDESLLTGESDHILKHSGDPVYSGTVVMAGYGLVKVTQIGQQTVASKIALEAKQEKKKPSMIMTALNRIIKTLSVVMVPVGLALFVSNFKQFSHGDLSRTLVSVVAALIGMIPEGLMLLTSVAFAVGVINLARKKLLVQTLPSIEMLARVDTICLDKTGTITNGKMDVDTVLLNRQFIQEDQVSEQSEASKFEFKTATDQIWQTTAQAIYERLSAFVKDDSVTNATQDALRAYFNGGHAAHILNRVPFSSKRKWSGAEFSDGHTIILGAPEFVLKDDPNVLEALQPTIQSLAEKGLRVLVVVQSSDGFGDASSLPTSLKVVALIALMDQLRENVHQTLDYFNQQGVAVKVISGDHPRTVCAIARAAGVPNADRWVDMSQVDESVDWSELVEKTTLFGRVTPFQKRQLVQAMQKNGHVVSMTGDGVNDVPALKESDCAVAMKSGSDAARVIADLVLLDDNVGSMVDAVYEGRRVINNIERVASLFLVKTVYSCLLSIFYIFLPFVYPLLPIQISLISSMTIGMPSFILALKPNRERIKGNFMRNIIYRSVPGGMTAAIMIILSQILSYALHLGPSQRSTLAVTILGFIGLLVLRQVSRPMDRVRRILFIVCATGLIGAMVVLPNIFFLGDLVSPIFWIYMPILVLCYAIFTGLKLIGHTVKSWYRQLRSYLKKLKLSLPVAQTQGATSTEAESVEHKPSDSAPIETTPTDSEHNTSDSSLTN